MGIDRKPERGLRFDKPNDRGFTLLEVLVAFFILAILLGLLFQVVKDTDDVGRRVENGNRIYENIQVTFVRIREELLSTYLNQNDPLTYFIGNPQYSAENEHDTLLFSSLSQTRLMQNAPVSHLAGIQYILVPEKHGKDYILAHEQDTNLLSYGTQAVVAEPLMHHVKSLRFLYFDGQQWTNQWNSMQSHLLPLLVKISMEIRNRNGKIETFTDVIPIPLSTVAQNK